MQDALFCVEERTTELETENGRSKRGATTVVNFVSSWLSAQRDHRGHSMVSLAMRNESNHRGKSIIIIG